MSTTLFFLVPIGMLAVVWSVCFVGCAFPTSGLPGPAYSDLILNDPNTTPSLLAYWTLSDLVIAGTLNTVGQTEVASDISGNNHNGTYTIPFAYPSATSPNAVANSDPIAAPSLARDTSIVPGDAGSKKNPLAASVNFQGGFVSVPWSSQNPPQLDSFTLEAWIALDPKGSGFSQVLFGMLAPGDATGIVILINENNNWQFDVGDGSTNTPIDTGISAVSGYVAVTFDNGSQTLSLWINPDSDTSAPPVANWPPPNTPPTTYAAAAPGQLAAIFIGAGSNEDTLRTAAGGTGAPRFPFVGQIQSVALYSSALQASDLAAHFEAGGSSS
jgi:hypothetical protein